MSERLLQDEFPDNLIRHCEQEALEAVAADTADLVRAVLSASGYAKLVAERDIAWASNAGLTTDVLALRAKNAELVAALEEARKRILDCRDHAMFSSKDTVVKHVAELLPRIDAALAAAGHKQGSGK
jgi:hypothetical protein